MEEEKGNNVGASEPGSSDPMASGNGAEVDLQALAEAIVALLKQEVRVENERQGR